MLFFLNMNVVLFCHWGVVHVDGFGIPLNDNVLLNDVLLHESAVKRKQQYEKSKRKFMSHKRIKGKWNSVTCILHTTGSGTETQVMLFSI